MNKKLELHFRDDSTITIDASVQHSKAILIEPHLLIPEGGALLLLLEHQKLNTHLDLTKTRSCTLCFFDDDCHFVGAAYSIGQEEAPFALLTQYKQVLFLPFDAGFPIHLFTKYTILS